MSRSMECRLCACIFMIFALFSQALGSTEAPEDIRATFSMNGVDGVIAFRPNRGGESTFAIFDLLVPEGKLYSWQLREFPVITSRPAAERCSADTLGSIVLDLSNSTISDVEFINSTTPSATIQAPIYPNPNISLIGHSLLLTSSDGDVVCATIQKVEAPMTKAILRTGIAGSVEIWQHKHNVYSVVTELFDTTGATNENEVEVKIYPGSVAADHLTATEQPPNRCDNIANGGEAAIVTFSSPVAALGLITRKKIIYFSDLSNLFQKAGETYMVIEESDRKHCANFNIVKPKFVKTVFHEQGVMGSISFSQDSPYHHTVVTVQLEGLNNTASGYHVHQYPVDYKYASGEDTRCANTESHFSPLELVQPLNENLPTHDMYEIGDLSGKHETLAGKLSINEEFVDWNLPLFGKYSIVGRSIVIHKTGGKRWVCANIGYPTEVITVQANFNLFAHGSITMIQEADDPTADTSVFISIQNADFKADSSKEHKYHIHRERLGDDANNGRCSSVGGHYNPFTVDLSASEYARDCLANELRCEVGDLSNKFGKLDLSSGNASVGKKSMFTAVNIPLSGAYSVLGRSIVIHDAQSGGPRYACADILKKPAVITKLVDWRGEKDAVDSSIVFSESALTPGTTAMTLGLRSLNKELKGYHVHKFATDEEATSPCGSTGGHYNPFNILAPFPVHDSHDRYELGDLSNKHGHLAEKDTFDATVLDSNLPLSGPNSIVGRSVVFHSASDNSRAMCADIVPDATAMGGHWVLAKAQFYGKVEGYIMFSQVITSDGYSDVTMNIDVRYGDGSVSEGHNWHVHLNPVEPEETGLCKSTKGHYNPFNADVGSEDYKTGAKLCSPTSHRRCEVGDLATRHGSILIGLGGKKVLNDGFLRLAGNESIMGRSIVIHAADGGAARIACATILPVAGQKHAMYVKKPNNNVESPLESMAAKVAAQVGTDRRNVAVDLDELADSCYAVTIHFSGMEAHDIKSKFDENNLGDYSSKTKNDCIEQERAGATWNTASLTLFVTMVMLRHFV